MTSRSREKVAAAFRRFFRISEKSSGVEGERNNVVLLGSPVKNNNNTPASPAVVASPSRRLLRCRDAVSPAELDTVGAPGKSSTTNSFFSKCKKKSVNSPCSSSTSSTNNTVGAESSNHAKAVRARRLMKELREIQKLQRACEKPSFTVELVNDNLYEWHINLFAIDPESDLSRDMKEYGINHIILGLNFPDNFPFSPPFMRVVSPRIEKGFVMEGGAICMELLTPRGWASAYTVEAIVMQFAASIVKGQGRISRKPKGSKEFSRRSAEESFRSLVKTHEKYGWVTPPLADG